MIDQFKTGMILGLCILMGFEPALASAAERGGRDEVPTTDAKVSEYVYREYGNQALIPVTVVGAVKKPGLYQVPPNTDFVTLLGLTGGMESVAEVGNITVRHSDPPLKPGQPRLLEQRLGSTTVDFDRLMRTSASRGPVLAPNDIVYVPAKQPWISNNAVTIVTVAASLIGIILSGIIIHNQLKK